MIYWICRSARSRSKKHADSDEKEKNVQGVLGEFDAELGRYDVLLYDNSVKKVKEENIKVLNDII